MQIIVTIFCQPLFAGSGVTYHGRIIKPDGVTPVSSATTQFRIQIRTPGTENCFLWEEQQTKDLSSTSGVFTITIADSSEPSLIANSLPFSFERVFSNRIGFASLSGCRIGNSYTPSSSVDGRNLTSFFRESPTDPWEQMPLTNVQVNTLFDIIAGTSNQYLKPNATFSGDVSGTYNNISLDCDLFL